MARTIYRTKITRVGAHASDFLAENMLIFFQENAPDYLADYCYLIEPGEGEFDIQAGDLFALDGVRCPVTAIGAVALDYFRQLGHLTVRFDGAEQALQPGTMHVRSTTVPTPAAGMEVRFLRD